jgi:hypothetical protein
MNLSDYAAFQNALLHMVVPMRREFGVAVDVPRMRVDIAYARFIVAQALSGGSLPLRESARLIDQWLQAAATREAESSREPDSTLPGEGPASTTDSRLPHVWRGTLARIARRMPLRLVP